MIHYHGLPMTPTADMMRALKARHAMVSFEYQQQIHEAAEMCQTIILDNGAFSAWRNGRAYDFSGYAAWVAHWLRHPAVEWCVIPDIIDGSEKDNDDLVLEFSKVGNVWQYVPVYHMHESLGRLDRLVTSYPRIALGSSGQYADPGSDSWWGRMAEMMAVACDEDGMPRTKLHGLRMLDPVIFSHVPLSSGDSCNVARNIGIDSRWNGSYVPQSPWARALAIIDRIESHASAWRWSPSSSGVQHNLDLLG